MDSISQISNSVDAVNQILQNAQAQTIKTAEKMMKVSVEMALGSEAGKGQLLDLIV